MCRHLWIMFLGFENENTEVKDDKRRKKEIERTESQTHERQMRRAL